jgi:hypothetical protein
MLVLLSAPAILASSAWTDFVSYSAPAAAPEGHVPALNMASTRRAGSTPDIVDPNQFAATAPIQNGAPADYRRYVTVNSFIANGTENTVANQDKIRKNIFKLCAAGAEGTAFAGTVNAAWNDGQGKVEALPPQCMWCLAKGFGSTEATPGFYLPCGCQQTCVDVSGRLSANFGRSSNKGLTGVQGFPTLPGQNMKPLQSCQDFVENQIVYSCPQVATYHFVLWPAILAAIALVYTAYSMMYMQLDMDSLLYTVGSSKKEN